VTFRGDQPDLGWRGLRVEADFLEKPILPIRISDRALASIRPGEDRHLAGAVIVYPLNAPFFRVKPIRKDDCWLRHCGELLPMSKLTRAPIFLRQQGVVRNPAVAAILAALDMAAKDS
jgi:hypothetical protein